MPSLPPIDLRSDTVTRPTDAMRRAIANAEVGDDVFGEDPTVRSLEERVADLVGKEAALFVTSGTMANQLAINLLTQPGDEVIIGEGAHCAFYETGAGAAISGVQFIVAGAGGLYAADDVDRCAKAPTDWHPRTSVVAIENTHNRAGGRVFPQADVIAIAARARSRGFSLHLDGARIWNAAAATGLGVSQLAAPFDTVSVCLSKGLGAPVGSLIVSTRDRILRARRLRKMLGGGMRQVGVLAAAGLHAIEHHRDRMHEDHANARRLHERVNDAVGGGLAAPDTNIVMIDLPDGQAAEPFVVRARESGVLVSAFGPSRLRAVTHLDVDAAAIERAGSILSGLIRSPSR